jgi:DNA-binding response OmpR family regulator
MIDHEWALYEVLSELFHEEGFDTIFWVAGRDDVSRIGRLEPDLIMLDLNQGWQPQGGLPLLFELSSRVDTATIPVLAICSSLHLFDAEEARLRAAACGVLVKPFDLDELLSHVDVCLRNYRMTAPIDLGLLLPPPQAHHVPAGV